MLVYTNKEIRKSAMIKGHFYATKLANVFKYYNTK